MWRTSRAVRHIASSRLPSAATNPCRALSHAAEEAALRYELAAAHLLQVRSPGGRLDDLVWNHLSARCPWAPEQFLVTPGSMLFDEIKPDDLVLAGGSTNVTATVIHSALYEARPDVMAVVHSHAPACMAVSCLKMGLQLLTQDGAGFYGKVGYHEWEGLSDSDGEKAALGRDLGAAPNHTLVMRNHGVAVVGESIGQAWVRGYYLDRVCGVQVDCLPALLALPSAAVHPPDEVLSHAAAQVDTEFCHGKYEWDALFRSVAKETAAWPR